MIERNQRKQKIMPEKSIKSGNVIWQIAGLKIFSGEKKWQRLNDKLSANKAINFSTDIFPGRLSHLGSDDFNYAGCQQGTYFPA